MNAPSVTADAIESAHAPAVSLKTWIAVLGSLLGGFMAVLDIQVTNSSLNDILGTLSATTDEGTWISTSYLVAEIIVIPLTAWLSDVFSLRRYLLVNAVLFLVFSVGCAWAWNLPSMIVFRVLQGFTGGVLIPLAFTIILKTLPRPQQPPAIALFILTATFAPAIGPAVGGWLTQKYGWPSIFYINLPIGAVLIAAIAWGMAKDKPQLHLLKKGDWWGISSMAVGLGSLIVFLEEGNRKDWFASPLMTRLAIVAVISLALFVIIELRRAEPFVNLRLFARRNFAFGNLVNTVMGMGIYGLIYLLPVYLAQVQGYNALQIGETLIWSGLPQLLILPLIPQLQKWIDGRVLATLGTILFGGSCLMMAFMSHDTAHDQLIWPQLIRALGQPLLLVPLVGITTGNIETEHAGSSSALFNAMRNLGGSIGIALLGLLLTKREQFHSARLGESVTIYDPATQQRLAEFTHGFVATGSDAVTAGQRAVAALDLTVRREAYVMAFNDCFYLCGVLLIASAVALWFCKKTAVQEGAVAH